MKAVNEAEVVEAVHAARDKRAPLKIVGNGGMQNFGRPIEGELLDVSGLTGISNYEPEELVLTTRAGTSLDEIAQTLAEKKQRLGFEPPDWGPLFGSLRVATIAGAVSIDASGPLRVRHGGARDQLLGIRAVNGFGDPFRAGGRVVKNVTGFDIPKLVCGAFGTLCVLTEFTFRVFPLPACSQTFAIRELEPAGAFATLRQVWSSPLEPAGLAYVPEGVAIAGADQTTSHTLFRLEGTRAVVEEKSTILRNLLSRFAVDEIDDGEALFREVGQGAPFHDRTLELWQIHVPPAKAFEAITKIEPSRWLADWSGALLWVGLPRARPDTRARVEAAASDAGGHAVMIVADRDVRERSQVFPRETNERARLTREIKAAFDPLALFNRGRMYEGV